MPGNTGTLQRCFVKKPVLCAQLDINRINESDSEDTVERLLIMCRC